MNFLIIGSFIFFTALVGVLTWFMTHKSEHSTQDGFFLAGRSLTFPFIAGSLLLTNLSTEQMVGLNGDAFSDGIAVMVWEVEAVLALVAMAMFFLPRFLRSGITTVPEFMAQRFDETTQIITNLIFLVAYAVILLPIVLYSGAIGMLEILDLPSFFNSFGSKFLSNPMVQITIIVWVVGIIGAIYALWGGLKSVAVSDTLNGIGLLIGGLMITYFAITMLGNDSFVAGLSELPKQAQPKTFNSLGGANSSVPITTVFSGILLLNLFYWCTNQQIIQRTFGASSLAEGQKGVLLCGAFKLIGPLFLVIPGIVAFMIFKDQNIKQDHAYGMLVNRVLPPAFTGFFAAAMMGAILSSFNSALNSTCTLFSLGIYKGMYKPAATGKEMVRSSRYFGIAIAIIAMLLAPSLSKHASIFTFLQKMNGIYFIPIFAVVFVGMTTRRVSALAAKVGLIGGVSVIALGYFLSPFKEIAQSMHQFHFLGLVFAYLVAIMLVIGQLKPRKEEWIAHDAKVVDLTPWRYAPHASIALIVVVLLVYSLLGDVSILAK